MFGKRFLVALLCMILFIPLRLAYGAEEPEVVRVGWCDFYNYIEQSASGDYSGYGYDYLQEIAEYTGWQYEFVPGTWEECIERLKKGEIDLMNLAQYSDARAEHFLYSQCEAGMEYALLLTSTDDDRPYYEDYEAFEGMRIGMLRDSYQNGLLEAYAQKHGFAYESVEVSSVGELERALEDGQIDAILCGSLQRLSGKKIIARFSPEPYYFITSKANGQLMDQLDEALENIQTTDVNYSTKLFHKYYEEAGMNQMAFTIEEALYARSHQVLKVAYNVGWNPISYSDKRNGEFSGISAGILRLISERSGIRFTYLPAASERDAIRMVAKGEADLLCGFSNHFREEAKEQGIILTKPFIEVPVTLARRSDITLDKIQKIAVPVSSLSLNMYAREQFPDAEFVEYPDALECVHAAERGRVDAVFENIYVLSQYQKNVNYANLEPILSMKTDLPVCIGMREDQDEALKSLLDNMISQLDPEEVKEIQINSTMEGPHVHPSAVLRQYGLPVLLLLIMIVAAALYFSKKQVEHYAFVDQLTGYDNETRFLLRMDKVRRGKGFLGYALVSLDIDKFKLINNMYSFETGNRILCAVSEVLKSLTGPEEWFCRKADDHFILLLKAGGKEEFHDRIHRLMDAVSSLPAERGESFQYTVSCGVFPFQESDRDIHRAMGWAIFARKSAKHIHQNHMVYYDSSMREKALREQEIENHMEEAVKGREFVLFYQPQIRLEDEGLCGAEALVRWMKHDGTIVLPDEFIPVFENNGFIVKLDLYVFECACRQLREWLDAGLHPCTVSVNLSQVHLNQPDFYKEYLEIMRKYEIPPSLIEMELTESTIFENKEQMVSLIRELKNAGISVAMDDFGSGYSSLKLLKDLPLDYLKLDKEFLNTSEDTQRGDEVIQSVIAMADKLQICVIAEGVEEEGQMKFLKEAGCKVVQGFYYSRPLAAKTFGGILKAGGRWSPSVQDQEK